MTDAKERSGQRADVMRAGDESLSARVLILLGSAAAFALTGLTAGVLAFTYWSWGDGGHGGWVWQMAYPLGLFPFVCACLITMCLMWRPENEWRGPVAILLALLVFGALLFLVFAWIVSRTT